MGNIFEFKFKFLNGSLFKKKVIPEVFFLEKQDSKVTLIEFESVIDFL